MPASGGSPDHKRPGSTSSALRSICAVMARAGSRLAFTAAFQPACRTALVSAAATSRASITAGGRSPRRSAPPSRRVVEHRRSIELHGQAIALCSRRRSVPTATSIAPSSTQTCWYVRRSRPALEGDARTCWKTHLDDLHRVRRLRGRHVAPHVTGSRILPLVCSVRRATGPLGRAAGGASNSAASRPRVRPRASRARPRSGCSRHARSARSSSG